jgi:hypothetical protein
MKAAATAAVDVWPLASTVCNRKQQADSTLQLDLFKGNQNLAGHGSVCVMYTCLNFVYPCGGLYARMRRLLFPVMDSKEDAIASLCYSEKCISVLVTV